MTDEKIKSDLQKKLESEGWRFMTNVADDINSHSLFEDIEYTKNLKNQFGDDNVRASEPAFDSQGNRMRDMLAVYVKESALAESQKK